MAFSPFRGHLMLRDVYTQSEIAKELGFASNSAVSKRLAVEQRFREMPKQKFKKIFSQIAIATCNSSQKSNDL